MLVNSKAIFKKAMKEGYAIPAYNASNMEGVLAIVRAAEAQNSPVILAASKSALEYAGLDMFVAMVKTVAEKSSVQVVLHLDHGADFEICKKCIDAGFTSVMIDGSSRPFEENVAVTKQVVDYAHQRGVTVEAELGKLAGVEDEVNVASKDAMYTDPNEAKMFVDLTGCDSLAIAIGTSHGANKFTGEAKLEYTVLQKIRNLLPETPLVLHGASAVPADLVEICNTYGGELKGAKGVPDDIIAKAVELGIQKVNSDTDLRIACTGAIRKSLHEKPESFDPRAYGKKSIEAMQKICEHKIVNAFGSVNKA